MELVTKREDLPSIPSAVMVKANMQPVDPTPLAENVQCSTTVPFASLLPISLHKASSIYSDLADRLLRDALVQMQDAADLTQATLQSLNLPGAVDSVVSDGTFDANLPQATVRRISEVHEKGGVSKLEGMSAQLMREREQCSSALTEALRILDVDEAEDLSIESARVPGISGPVALASMTSAKATRSALRETGKSHLEKLVLAKRSDGVVREKMDSSYNLLALISLPMVSFYAV
jgi:hypothetical protein